MAKAVGKAKRAAVAPADVIDVGPANLLPALTDDEQFVTQAGQGVLAFLRSLSGFFTVANAMESNSKATFAVAQALAAPKTPDEDERIQRFVKDTNDQRKTVEEHWKVTTIISGFHRRMTAARARATDPLERAATIGNQLHQRFRDDADRAARIEQDRVSREAEEKAQRERQDALDRMEAEAVRAEESSPKLSEREQQFVDIYTDRASMGYDNGQKAATMVGFKKGIADAARLLSLPKIQQAIEFKTRARALREQKEAVASKPVAVDVPIVEAAVHRASGTSERTYYAGELLSEQALIDAICEGRLGIPRDLLSVKPAKLNEYANSMKDLINRWPGVRLKKTVKVQ